MNIKKIISLLASMAMAVTAITGAMTASASEVANGTCGDLTWTLDSEGVLTISGEGKMATPDTYSSTDVYSNLYTYKEYTDSVREVVIEEGITSIGWRAFYNFSNLETVSIPSSITEYPVLNNGVILQNSAFENCKSLENIKFSDDLTCLGAYSFSDCTSLESVTIPQGITTWGQGTFSGCTSLKDITLPDGLAILGAAAFEKTGVESVYIPSSIQKWDDFSSYFGSAGSQAFFNCTNLKSVTFGDGITEIPEATFKECTSLEEVAFGDDSQITEIGKEAFRNCTNLKRVEIPNNVTEFGNSCFNDCNSLQSIYIYTQEQ